MPVEKLDFVVLVCYSNQGCMLQGLKCEQFFEFRPLFRSQEVVQHPYKQNPERDPNLERHPCNTAVKPYQNLRGAGRSPVSYLGTNVISPADPKGSEFVTILREPAYLRRVANLIL